MLDRIRLHIGDENVSSEVLEEYIRLAKDRICLRLGEETCPARFNSIVVDIVVKLYRRKFFEGIESENVSGESVKFIKNLLEEYNYEFETYLAHKRISKVRFI